MLTSYRTISVPCFKEKIVMCLPGVFQKIPESPLLIISRLCAPYDGKKANLCLPLPSYSDCSALSSSLSQAQSPLPPSFRSAVSFFARTTPFYAEHHSGRDRASGERLRETATRPCALDGARPALPLSYLATLLLSISACIETMMMMLRPRARGHTNRRPYFFLGLPLFVWIFFLVFHTNVKYC